jgi:hypothetical protein
LVLKQINDKINKIKHKIIKIKVIGFGHATLSSAQHTAFFFAINLECLGPNREDPSSSSSSCDDNRREDPNRDSSHGRGGRRFERGRRFENDPLSLSFMPAHSYATPFAGFSYMDPTSFWISSSSSSSQENQSGGSGGDNFARLKTTTTTTEEEGEEEEEGMRLFVMCTLRAAPDYLSFDPSHHQTVIFEAKTDLLDMILSKSNNSGMRTSSEGQGQWIGQFKSVEESGGIWL